ncbi:hypothetical protein CW304_16175 [Bacillus sp. UFRGS-B20]|nr:hypothetical protein CW304_16175 [Bacillus sp. UFRGS-B20]
MTVQKPVYTLDDIGHTRTYDENKFPLPLHNMTIKFQTETEARAAIFKIGDALQSVSLIVHLGLL